MGTRLTGDILMAVFAVVALRVALNMALRPANTEIAAGLPRAWPRHGIGGVIGGFSVSWGSGAAPCPYLS